MKSSYPPQQQQQPSSSNAKVSGPVLVYSSLSETVRSARPLMEPAHDDALVNNNSKRRSKRNEQSQQQNQQQPLRRRSSSNRITTNQTQQQQQRPGTTSTSSPAKSPIDTSSAISRNKSRTPPLASAGSSTNVLLERQESTPLKPPVMEPYQRQESMRKKLEKEQQGRQSIFRRFIGYVRSRPEVFLKRRKSWAGERRGSTKSKGGESSDGESSGRRLFKSASFSGFLFGDGSTRRDFDPQPFMSRPGGNGGQPSSVALVGRLS